MYPRQSYRDNPVNWAFSLGRLFGIHIRIHLLFVLWILFRLIRGLSEGTVLFEAVLLFAFFGTVLLHEFGHCFGARRMGGDADNILMWPLGGLAMVSAPMTPWAQFITTASGPLVNFTFCALAAVVLLIAGQSIPLNPFSPFVFSHLAITQWAWFDWLGLIWGVNYILLLFNLLPIFPMDGGRILQTILWKHKGYNAATLIATFVGMVGAVIFGLVGLVSEEILLVCIAVFGYITCMQERHMVKAGLVDAEGAYGYDFSKGYAAFEEPERKPSWFERKRAAREARKQQEQVEERRRHEIMIDQILDKVHREGIQVLTNKEKKLLESETQRKQTRK